MKIYPLHLNALTDPFTPQIRAILTALPTADHQTYDHPQTPIKAIATPAIAATIRLPAPRIADLYRENLPYFSRGYHKPLKASRRASEAKYGANKGIFDGGLRRQIATAPITTATSTPTRNHNLHAPTQRNIPTRLYLHAYTCTE